MVLVLDVSGSMAGEKLSMAVAGALALVESAAPEDRLGVVVFSSGHRVLFPPRPMTAQAKKEAESLLLSLRAGGTVLGGPSGRRSASSRGYRGSGRRSWSSPTASSPTPRNLSWTWPRPPGWK